MSHLTFVKNVGNVLLQNGQQVMMSEPNRLFAPTEDFPHWKIYQGWNDETKLFTEFVIVTVQGMIIQGTLDPAASIGTEGEPEYEEKDY